MNYSGFAANLRLTYAPISNHDFASINGDPDFRQSLTGAMLYAICQRPMLSFEDVKPSPDGQVLHFEIHMQNSSKKLLCSLPLHQAALDNGAGIYVESGFYDEADRSEMPPYTGVNGIKFYSASREFLLWLSPDKFLHHYWNKRLIATVKGDLREFTKFHVHYVGKATDQPAIDRLRKHNSLQAILSLVKPLVKGTLPTHEIMLLLFEVGSVSQVATLAGGDYDSLVAALGGNLPAPTTVALDAEKALVQLLQPGYNHPTKRFPNYPVSTDGLYKYQFDKFTFQILEAITLHLNQVVLRGSIDGTNVDLITIDANTKVEIAQLS